MLQIRIRGILMSFLLFALGVEFYQITSNILELALGAFFEFVPCAGAQFVELGRNTFFSTIFCQLMLCMYAHKYYIIVLICEFNHLLHATIDFCAHQARKTAHSVIDMHKIIAHFDCR